MSTFRIQSYVCYANVWQFYIDSWSLSINESYKLGKPDKMIT